jgi:hypothetical protein
LLQKVYGTLDPCFISTHIIQKEGVLQIYFCVIFHETRHVEQAHITFGAFIHRALSLAERSTQQRIGLMILLASDCYGDSRVAKHFCTHTCYNQSVVGVILALFSFLSQLPHQKEPEISVGIVKSRSWKNNFMVHLLLH